MDMNRSMSELVSDLKAFCIEQRLNPFDFEDMTLVIASNHTVWIPDELFAAGHERER